MRAVVVKEHGPPSSLKVTVDVPRPPRGKGEAFVRVVGAGTNPVDWKIRAGPQGGGLPAKLPQIIGGDLSGVVLEADDDSKFKPGDKVYALTQGFHWDNDGHDGCYCEVSAVPVSALAAPPASMPLTEAAAVPLVALTAWQTLAHAPDEAIEGKRVLVHAGAGGVGHVALQLAKNARGATFVAATGRPHSHDFLRSLGADEAIDYTVPSWDEEFLKKKKKKKSEGGEGGEGEGDGEEEAKKFDVIFDLIGGDSELKSYKLLKKGGYYLHVFNTGTDPERSAKTKAEWAASGEGFHYEGPTLVVPDGKALEEISRLIDDGKLRVEISKVLPLEEAGKAHEELEKLSVRGKIVLKVSDE